MRHLVPAWMWIAVVGCSASHGLGTDGAVPNDATVTVDGSTACTGPGPICVQATGHVCGDASPPPECVGGAWECPAGWSNDPSECWCYGPPRGDCACTPSGWQCAMDAGAVGDAGACPSDVNAEGTACAPEGRSCPYLCDNPCGFCSILQCVGGRWARIEAFPPAGLCTPFECGSSQCNAVTAYCQHTVSDVGGVPDAYTCVDYPADCTSCDCLGGNECAGVVGTGITVTYYGG